jgi:hypothetical protein
VTVVRERGRGGAEFNPDERKKDSNKAGYKMLGRPLTRDEERRIAAESGGHSVGSRSQRVPRRDVNSAEQSQRVPRRDLINPTEQFAPLFVLGMLGGIAMVFIVLFML